MAPPFTFILSCDTFSCCMKYMTTEAKASFSSNRSMSPMLMPARARAFCVTATGPVSMMVGSEPIEAEPTMRARGFSPIFSPISLVPIRTPEAPSTMPEELPAWCTWSIASISG